MASRSDPTQRNAGKQGMVLGRSAATGRLVLAPASKRGLVSVEEARRAARAVSAGARAT